MTKYFIDDDEVEEQSFWDRFSEECYNEADEHIDDWLDDCCEEVHIGVFTFTASEILKNCDPVAYRCSVDDYEDVLYSDGKYDLERGDTVSRNCVDFEIRDEDDDEIE